MGHRHAGDEGGLYGGEDLETVAQHQQQVGGEVLQGVGEGRYATPQGMGYGAGVVAVLRQVDAGVDNKALALDGVHGMAVGRR